MKKSAFIYIPILLLVLACQEKNNDNQAEAAKEEISVYPTTLEFKAGAGESFDLFVKSTTAWKMDGWSDALGTWLSVDKRSGEGNETIHVSVIEANPYSEDRVATLTFAIENGPKARLSIRQDNDPDRTISLSTEEIRFGPALGENETLTVQTSKPWTLEGYTDEIKQWLSVTPTEGSGEQQLSLSTIVAGAKTETRTAELTFRIDRVNSVSLNISQKPAISISVDPESVVFETEAGESGTVVITPSTALLPWSIQGYNDEVSSWLDISQLQGSGTATLSLSTKTANDSEEDRSALLSISIAEDVSCTLSVTQKGKPAAETEVQLYADGPKWAVCNLGATNPWDYGDYFAWGATEPMYKSLTWTGPANGGYSVSVTWGKKRTELDESEAAKYGADAAFDGYKIKNAPYYKSTTTYNKYNSSDKLKVLQTGDDAATAILGDGWRTPTRADWNKLYESCTWTWQNADNTEFSGVTGYKVEGKGDYEGKYIFIPATGYFLNAEFRSAITNGYYWSADLHTDALKAWRPTFSGTAVTIAGSANRCYGLPVRPVLD